MLKTMGLPVYQHLNVHGYWNVGGRKIAKALGNMVSPLAMKESYGFDAFRYFLLREMVFGLDSTFSEVALIRRINADLANNLGNLVSRTLNMTARFAGGAVPKAGEPGDLEREIQAAAPEVAARVDRFYPSLRVSPRAGGDLRIPRSRQPLSRNPRTLEGRQGSLKCRSGGDDALHQL